MRIWALLAVLAGSIFLAPGAMAQLDGVTQADLDPCQNREGRYSAPYVVEACTQLIATKASSNRNLSAFLHWRSTAYRDLGNWQAALADLARLQPLDTTPVSQSFAMYRRAEIFLAQRKAAEALAEIDRALALNRSDFGAHAVRGKINERLGNFREAAADYDRGLIFNPNHLPSLSLGCMVRAWELNRELAKARQYCEAALRISAGPNEYNGRGLIGLREGRYREAYEDFDASMHLYPFAFAQYARGLAASHLGLRENAERDMQAAAQAIPALVPDFKKRGFFAAAAPQATLPAPAPIAGAAARHDWRLADVDRRKPLKIVYWIAADTIVRKEGNHVSAVVRTDHEGQSTGITFTERRLDIDCYWTTYTSSNLTTMAGGNIKRTVTGPSGKVDLVDDFGETGRQLCTNQVSARATTNPARGALEIFAGR